MSNISVAVNTIDTSLYPVAVLIAAEETKQIVGEFYRHTHNTHYMTMRDSSHESM